ncbi:Conserved_hypothetical protein [Hexamita inflata]|uniref:Dynein axonemal assembly factor 5 TPR repeats domain-containing protein n=1 Tax=Hexamita inflata TaxID=28002 RepID=A0ABP1GJ47_9EUKA
MNSQKIYNTLISDDATKPEQKAALDNADQLLQGSCSNEEIVQVSQALASRFNSEYDTIRQKALDIYLANIQKIIPLQLQQIFYNVYKCLYTVNLRYDAYIRSETSRQTLLSILLKLIIYFEKLNVNDNMALLQQQQQPITEILIRQIVDPCPENRILCCKCIFRFSRAFKFLLTDQQIHDLSEALVTNYNHQRSTLRQLSLQAFVQLHLCVQSKDINKYWNPLLTFLLNDDKSQEALVEASVTLLTQHIDRHVYVDIFALPLLANLQDPLVLQKFSEIGDFYVSENRKNDKFLQLQMELETSNQNVNEKTKQYDLFIKQFNEKYFKDSAFKQQLNMGCRVIAQICLQKNAKTILADMKAVNSSQTMKLSQLMCNLMILCENFCLKFSSELLQNLNLMIHDAFHAQDYEKVVHLIAKFTQTEDILQLLKAQLNGTQSILGLSRIYGFCTKYIEYVEINAQQTEMLLEIMLGEDANSLEDQVFLEVLILLLVALMNRKLEMTPRSANLTAVTIASIVERSEPIFNRSTTSIQQRFQDAGLNFDYKVLLQQFVEHLNINQDQLVMKEISNIIGLERDFSQTKNLLLKIKTFSRLLQLTQDTNFHTKNIVELIRINMKLLKSAQNHEKVDRYTRYEQIHCVKHLIMNTQLDDQQLQFFLENLFLSSTWKHGARSPECLSAAMEAIAIVMDKFSSVIDQTSLDTILQKICVNIENDQLSVRLASIQLCKAFFNHIFKFNLAQTYKFEELAYNLIQRLDDCKTGVTLSSLDLFDQLVQESQKIETQKGNICLLLVTHLNDEVSEIRNKCKELILKYVDILGKQELLDHTKGKVFEWIKIEEILM